MKFISKTPLRLYLRLRAAVIFPLLPMAFLACTVPEPTGSPHGSGRSSPPGSDKTSSHKAKALAPFPKPETVLSELRVVKALSGTTGPQLVQDAHGNQFVRKYGGEQGKDPAAHVENEYHANLALRALGVPVPDVMLYKFPDTSKRPFLLSRFMKGTSLGEVLKTEKYVFSKTNQGSTNARIEKIRDQLKDHFVADCLLGNYDVVGSAFDNLLIGEHDVPYRIDNGGALEFRAQGRRKTPAEFSDEVSELLTLRGIAPSDEPGVITIPDVKVAAQNALTHNFFNNAAEMFWDISPEKIISQINDILSRQSALDAAIPASLRAKIDARLGFLKKYKAILEQQKRAWETAAQGALDNKNTTVTFSKHFASDALTLGGRNFKAVPADDFSAYKLVSFATAEPNFLPPAGNAKKAAAGVIIVEADGRVWLLEPRNHFGATWTFPKGRLDEALPPDQAERKRLLQATAVREAYEEVGLKVKLTGFLMDQERSSTFVRYYIGERVAGDPGSASWEASAIMLAQPSQAFTVLDRKEDRELLKVLPLP